MTHYMKFPTMTFSLKFLLRPCQQTRIVAVWFLIVVCAACSRQNPEALIQSAREFIAKKDYAAAAIQLKNALQQQENSEVQFLLGTTLRQLGDYSGAALQLRRALETGYSPEKVYPELAQVLLYLGEVKKLSADLLNVELRLPEANAAVKTILGEALLLNGQPGEARDAFKKALAIIPGYARAQIGLARAQAVGGDMAGAEKIADEILAREPELAQALSLKADLLIARGQLEQALPLLQALVRATPFDGQPRFALVSVLMAGGKFDEAAREIAAMKKALPRDVRSSYLEGVLAFRRGEPAKARDAVLVVLNTIPDHGPSLLLSGAAEYQLGYLSTAEGYLRKVVASYPNNLFARNLLISTYLRKGQPGKAEEALAPALKVAPMDPTVLRAAGEVYFANNQLAEAAKYYDRALAIEKDDVQLKTRLAQIRMARGDSDRALDELEAASGLDKSQYQADLSLVAAFLQSKNYDKALAAAEKLEAKQPSNPLTFSVKGVIYLAKQDVKSARTSLEKALSLQYNYLPAARILANLDVAEKNPNAAKARFDAILQRDPNNDGALLSQAETQIALREPTKDITATLERAVKANPSSAAARVALVKFYLQNREPKNALDAAQAANTAVPNDARILDILGLAQLAAGETNQAIESFNKLASLMPESTLPLMRLASAQYAAKQLDAPIQALRKALVLKPDLLEAQRQIVAVQLAAGRTDEALRETKAVQKARPKEAVGYAMEGDVLASQKRYAEAAAAYAEGMKRQPTSDLVVRQYKLMRESGKSAEAANLVSRWLKDHPEDSAVRFSLATEAAQTNDYKAAVERFGAILATQPNNAAVLNNMAWVLNELKDSSALGYAEKAFAQAPANPQIQDTYGWLLVESGDIKRGIEILAKATASAPESADIRLHLAKAYLKAGDKSAAKRELENLSRDGAGKAKDEASALLRAM